MIPAASSGVQLRFIVLMGFLISASALAVDAMLTSIPAIGAELTPAAPHRAHLTISIFFAGIATGTLLWGPVSDAIGRRKTIVIGLALYGTAAFLSAYSGLFEVMLAGRFVQGFGASAMRIVVNAIIRDQYSGRVMARVSSFVTLLFVIVPGVAPLLGYWVSEFAGWRGVFWAFSIFSAIGLIWFLLQQKETLAAESRRPLRVSVLWNGIKEVFGSSHNRLCIAVQALVFGGFYALLTNIQQIYEITFGLPVWFPYLMGGASLIGGTISMNNAWAVIRFGMVGCLRFVLIGFLLITGVVLLIGITASKDVMLIAFVVWTVASFATINVVASNIIALALQPLPHIAGLATSVQISTGALAGVVISIPVTFAFDGSFTPLLLANFCTFGLAVLISLSLRETED